MKKYLCQNTKCCRQTSPLYVGGSKSLENLIRERGNDPDTLDDVITALKVFDADRDGKISVEEFTYAMVNMGERMTEQEIQEIVADCQLVNNN